MLRTTNKKTKIEEEEIKGYNSSLYSIVYANVPTFECNLTQIEHTCLDRITLLDQIVKLKDSNPKGNSTSLDVQFFGLVTQYLGKHEHPSTKLKDELSHFMCRIAMCDSEEDKDWFINAEALLLNFRLSTNDLTTHLEQFTEFGWSKLTTQEFETYQKDLEYLVLTSNGKPIDLDINSFYKIPFEDVPKLVEHGKVVLKKGWAIVFKAYFRELIICTYRNYLEFAIEKVKQDKARFKTQYPEIAEILRGITRPTIVNSKLYGANSSHIKKEQIPELSKTFPLCMRVMHDHLISYGKLMHDGRLQYGTFLKGIGLSLDEALGFWKNAFSKRVTSSEFDKEYAYQFRHTYGQEGKGISYDPYSCEKIQRTFPSGKEQVHGCPYLWDSERLEKKLLELGIDPSKTYDIVEASKTQSRMACTKHFHFLHPNNNNLTGVINHPNFFFEQSKIYFKQIDEKNKKSKENSKNNNGDVVLD
ncbi:hypothetical protein CYY_007114 [Polysphondylium violaceum]|uniref:DNA primase large subunit C-terminal domain-containing protein n=1 Tax=Polysphondylium violaceum TaxID=133409 RepID=A0A8J4PP41_9MYCE|nr:hypothetical protein CYY_007114 [Polysphondylium violaceum]